MDQNKTLGDTITLQPPNEFRFAPNLAYLSRSPHENMHVVDNGKLRKLLTVAGESVLIEISSRDDHELAIRFVDSVPQREEVRSAVVRYVREWFDLDRDLAPFYEMAGHDPLLSKAVEQSYGLRVIGVPDLFEALCWTIIGQQITLSFAYTIKKRLVETYGTCKEWEGQAYWSFPTPDVVAGLSVEQLRELQLITKRAEYMIGVAELFRDGALSKESMMQLGDLNAVQKKLTSIRGIGPWSASYVRMRCFRDPDAFPVQDVGLQNAIRAGLGMDRKPTIEEMHDLAANWGSWKAYATFYLWMTLYHSIA
ncbi:MAG: DNA-3-methyladenine glycosylase family protein [Tumebacillaceae bacterium]